LGEPGIAQIVVEALRHHHERNVEVLAYCVMPDHVHVLIAFRSKGVSLSRWVGDLKRWVSRRASSDLAEDLQWQPSFYEHVVRSDEDAVVLARYILSNPVRAGLVEDWRNFPWSGSFAWQL
jgi:putative transposase